MTPTRARGAALITLMLLGLSAAGCGSKPVSGGAGVFYELPLIPIRVTYDALSRRLQVSISGKLQTPIGTFGITAGVGTSQGQTGGARTLTIQAGDKRHVYKLDKGQRYSINLPSDENGEAKVVYSDLNEDLSVIIPNPTNETVSGLREQLRAEQEARQREREETAARESELQGESQPSAECCSGQGSGGPLLEEQQPSVQQPFAGQPPAEDAAQRQRELDARRQAEEYRQQLERERELRADAERREMDAQRRRQDAERQRDDQARRDAEERRRRRDERTRQIIGLGEQIYRDIKRRRN